MKTKLRSIDPASLLKYLAGSFGAFYAVLGVIFGVLGMAGCNTVHLNQRPITGIPALPVSLAICGLLWIVTTGLCWVALASGFPLFRVVAKIELEGDGLPEQATPPVAPSPMAGTSTLEPPRLP